MGIRSVGEKVRVAASSTPEHGYKKHQPYSEIKRKPPFLPSPLEFLALSGDAGVMDGSANIRISRLRLAVPHNACEPARRHLTCLQLGHSRIRVSSQGHSKMSQQRDRRRYSPPRLRRPQRRSRAPILRRTRRGKLGASSPGPTARGKPELHDLSRIFVDTILLSWHDQREMAATLPAVMWYWLPFRFAPGDGRLCVDVCAGPVHRRIRRPERGGPAVWRGLHFAAAAGLLFLVMVPAAPYLIALQAGIPKPCRYSK